MQADVDRLKEEKDIAQLCPWYVDVQIEVPRLQVGQLSLLEVLARAPVLQAGLP